MYMDETGHISNFVVMNLIVILQWGNKGGEGEGEVEIIHMCIYSSAHDKGIDLF